MMYAVAFSEPEISLHKSSFISLLQENKLNCTYYRHVQKLTLAFGLPNIRISGSYFRGIPRLLDVYIVYYVIICKIRWRSLELKALCKFDKAPVLIYLHYTQGLFLIF